MLYVISYYNNFNFLKGTEGARLAKGIFDSWLDASAKGTEGALKKKYFFVIFVNA